MALAFFCNKFGYNPKSCITSATGIFCGFAGVTKREPQPSQVQVPSMPRPTAIPPPIPKPAPPPTPLTQQSATAAPQAPVTKRHIQRPVF